MGRVKNLAIKSTTRKLLNGYPKLFESDFEHNKTILRKIITSDKRTRNAIAGYLTKLVKKEEK